MASGGHAKSLSNGSRQTPFHTKAENNKRIREELRCEMCPTIMAETETRIVPLTLNKQQAADALNVRVDTLLNLTRTGQLRSVQIGKHKRWLMVDLHEYVENQRSNKPCARKVGR